MHVMHIMHASIHQSGQSAGQSHNTYLFLGYQLVVPVHLTQRRHVRGAEPRVHEQARGIATVRYRHAVARSKDAA